jgi:hypothetical protein
VEEDGLDGSLRVWREVARKLAEHLAAPDGPTSGQAQFRPWYRTDPPIGEYVFCLSSLLANERQRQDLRDEIQGSFQNLATAHAHLRHLGSLRVLVRDWEDLSARLSARPHLLFRWFPKGRPRGLVVLGEEAAGSRFSEYLTGARLPYYARRQHLADHPAPAGREIPDEEGLLASFEATGARGLVITGGGGFGKTRLMVELGLLAQAVGWAVFRVQGNLRTEALEVLAERLRPETPALVLVDYIETQPAYGDWVETLEILADQRKISLRYVACCRSAPGSIERTPPPMAPVCTLTWLKGPGFPVPTKNGHVMVQVGGGFAAGPAFAGPSGEVEPRSPGFLPIGAQITGRF